MMVYRTIRSANGCPWSLSRRLEIIVASMTSKNYAERLTDQDLECAAKRMVVARADYYDFGSLGNDPMA